MSLNKILVLLMAAVFLFTSCYAKVVVFQEAPVTESVKQEAKVDPGIKTDSDKKPLVHSGELLTGLSFSANTTSSTDGNAQADGVMVAVSVDTDGIIRDCIIDSVQAKVPFDDKGIIQADINVPVESKNELGPRYGMAKASGIGKEWNEQMEALSRYVVGKTAAEVQGISFKDGKPEDVDLASSVTVYMGGFLSQIVEAVENAQYRGASVGDKLEMVSYTTLSSSKNAEGDVAGNAQADINVMVLTLSGDRITSAYTDSIQAKVPFDSRGKLVGSLSEDVASKNELKENYGMGAYSSIGADWYKQAESYSAYITGKTIDEVLGVAVNEKFAPADTDLSSSVTMSIGSFNNMLKKVSL